MLSDKLRQVEEYIILSCLVALPCLFILAYVRIKDVPFTLCNDQLYQYDIFYREWYRLLTDLVQNRNLPLYSRTMFLGTDFFASMSYYCTGDLLFLICLPFIHHVENVKAFLTFETIVCIYISAGTFYWCLKQCGVRKPYILISSALIYAFGGWSVSYYGIYMFHRFYALFPLLIGSTDYYYRTSRSGPFVISTAALFLQNFYFMYPASIFLLMYCLMKEWKIRNSISDFFRDVCKLFAGYLIGMCIAAPLLVPAVLTTISNSRVGTGGNGLLWEMKTYAGLFLSPVNSPFPEFTRYQNLFYIDGGSHDYWFSINIGILLFIYAVEYCLKAENKEERLLLIVLILCLVFRPLSSMMHGFSEPSLRWMFCLQIYLQILGTRQYEESSVKNNRIIAIYMIGCFAAVGYLASRYQVTAYAEQFLMQGICLLVSLLTWFLHRRFRKAGLIFSACWMIGLGCFYTAVRASDDYGYRVLIDPAEIVYYDSLDPDPLHRYYIPSDDMLPGGVLAGNVNMDSGFLSSKTYNSMYDQSTAAFNQKTGNYLHFISIDDPYALTMIGTKYWIVLDESELSEELHFAYAHPLSYLQVYENLDYHGFAYTLPQAQNISCWTDNRQLMDTLFVDAEGMEITDGDAEQLQITYSNNHYLEGSIHLDHANILLVALPDNPGWSVMVDGRKAETVTVNGGFIGIPLEAGSHTVTMNFITHGLKTGCVMMVLGLCSLAVLLYMERRKRSE